MSRKKYDDSFKRKVVQEYKAGGISCYALGQKYGGDGADYISSMVRNI